MLDRSTLRLALARRAPEGVARQKGLAFATAEGGNTGATRWHGSALFISDNVATQMDGLGHITRGEGNAWYNGSKEAGRGGNFGLLKTDATTIPPVVARGVTLDIAGLKGLDALPAGYEMTVEDLDAAMRVQNVDVSPGTVVSARTGTARYGGATAPTTTRSRGPDSAGLGMTAAKT